MGAGRRLQAPEQLVRCWGLSGTPGLFPKAQPGGLCLIPPQSGCRGLVPDVRFGVGRGRWGRRALRTVDSTSLGSLGPALPAMIAQHSPGRLAVGLAVVAEGLSAQQC